MSEHTNHYNEKSYYKIINDINDSKIQIHSLINSIKKLSYFSDFIDKIKTDTTNFNKFLTIIEIDSDLFYSLIKSIESNEKGKYKKDYCNEYKLILIFQMTNTLVKWKDLTKSIFYDPKQDAKYHYKSIHSQFSRWCNNRVFKNAFFNCVPNNNDDILIQCFNDNDNNFHIVNDKNDLFIDSTHINNKYGSEQLIVNPELKKKKLLKFLPFLMLMVLFIQLVI